MEKKLRNTCDIYPLTGKGVQYANNYADCVSQHVFNIFIALYTNLGYIMVEADAISAYAQTPNPYQNIYAHVYDQ